MKPAVLSIVYLGVMAALYISGRLPYWLDQDVTRITLGMIGFTMICTALATYRRKLLIWTIDNGILPSFGFLGTVLGFMLTLSGIEGAVEATKLAGVSSALITTAGGMMLHIWCLAVREATR